MYADLTIEELRALGSALHSGGLSSGTHNRERDYALAIEALNLGIEVDQLRRRREEAEAAIDAPQAES